MRRWGPIVVAYDGSAGGDAALRAAIELGARASLPVEAIYVYEPVAHLAELAPPVDFETQRDALEVEMRSRLHAVAEEVEVPFEVVEGLPADAVLAAAAGRDASLIVTGTRQRRAVAELLLGSFARQLTARCDRPVLVVPPPP